MPSCLLRSDLLDYICIHCLNENIFLIVLPRLWLLIIAEILPLLDIRLLFVFLLYKALFSTNGL